MVTLRLQAELLSDDALHDLTRELCGTLNREADVEATIAEAPATPGARGHPIAAVINIVGAYGPDVLKHGGGVILGESVLVFLRPLFERYPTIRAYLRGEGGKQVVLAPESVHPDHVQQTAKEVGEILAGQE